VPSTEHDRGRLELALRQSLAMSDGQYAIFVSRPIAGSLLAFGALLVLLNLLSWVARGLDWRRRLPLTPKGERTHEGLDLGGQAGRHTNKAIPYGRSRAARPAATAVLFVVAPRTSFWPRLVPLTR